jgi:excisionase family DNA binding protein
MREAKADAVPQESLKAQRQGSSPNSAVLTAREACEYLRISKWTLYKLIRGCQIKAMKIGNRRLVRRKSLENYMDEREAQLG